MEEKQKQYHGYAFSRSGIKVPDPNVLLYSYLTSRTSISHFKMLY